MILRTKNAFSYEFYMVCSSQPPKIWWHASVQAKSTLSCCHFESPKTNISARLNNFDYKLLSNNAEFISMENNSDKKFPLENLLFIEWLLCVYIYIYI